jgi:hypothetical protein
MVRSVWKGRALRESLIEPLIQPRIQPISQIARAGKTGMIPAGHSILLKIAARTRATHDAQT